MNDDNEVRAKLAALALRGERGRVFFKNGTQDVGLIVQVAGSGFAVMDNENRTGPGGVVNPLPLSPEAIANVKPEPKN